jgi:hypothetical protein
LNPNPNLKAINIDIEIELLKLSTLCGGFNLEIKLMNE